MKFFTTTKEIQPFLPDGLKHRSEIEWLELSRDGSFVPHFFFTGQNEAWYRKSAVLRWCENKYGQDRKDLIAAMKAAGFEPVQ